MCAELGVTEQGYYQWLKRAPSARAIEDQELTGVISRLHRDLDGNPGRRRTKAGLRVLGYRISMRRVHRLMTEMELVGRHPKSWRTTTLKASKRKFPRDHLRRKFTAKNPNKKWVGDITYIKTWNGWVYLATVIDLHSRKVVGWAIADHMRTELIIDALGMALTRRKPAGRVTFHSDRGAQYCSKKFRKFCKRNNVRRSMGRTGVCYDNAVAESFFASYKKELIFTKPWVNISEVRNASFAWIEMYYNRKRRHSTLDYLTPEEFELGYRSVEELYAVAA